MPDEATARAVRRIRSNLVRLLGGKVGAALIGLAYQIIAARWLGARDYGVLVLVHGFAMTVGGIVEFPGWHAIVRYGSAARAEGDAPRLARLLRFALKVEAAGGACAVVIAAVIGPWLGPSLGWSPVAVAFAVPYSLAVLASIRATPAGYLQLMGRFDLLGAHNLVAPLVRLAGALVAVACGAGLQGFLIAWLVAALAEWVSMWALGAWVARTELRGVRAGRSSVRRDNPGIWRFMLGANVDITLGELAGRVAPLVVGAVLGPASAGLFAVAARVAGVIAQPAAILGQAAYAELARLVAAGESGSALRAAVLRCIGMAILAALPVLGLTVAWGREVAVLMGGQAFAGAAVVMPWLVLARIMLLPVPPASAALTALGRPGLSVTGNLVASLAVLPLLPLMLTQWGLPGAGWNAVLQASAASALLLWFAMRATGSAHPQLSAA